MGLLVLLSALLGTISETARENAENRRAAEEQRRYEDIDWYNIEYVTLDGTETAYRIEEKEEFDPVMTDFLSRQDGWAHYETETVQYEVEDGENYCFTIRYKNGTEIYRKFHEDSDLTERLLEYCNNNNSNNNGGLFGSLFDTIDEIDSTVTKLEKVVDTKLSEDDSHGDVWNKQAVICAKSYLECDGISRQSLFKQLKEQEKFTDEQAKYAVDNCGANWNNQAVESAKSYLLNCSGFSYSGLTHQLQEFEGFTLEQAKYGVENSGADWNEQAVISAKSYLDCGGYSKQSLIEQLKDEEKFTDEQAEYAVNVVGLTVPSSELKQEQKERFAVIDLETTGLNYNLHRPPMDEIISVAIIDQDENVLLDTYCDTIKIKSWDEAERIHGISPSDVMGYPTFVEILPKVIEILSSYDYVIAYNIKFEKLFIQNYAYHYARDYLFEFGKINWGDDPMKMFMSYMGSGMYMKLETAARHFGYTYDAHNALEDTKATLHVYKMLRNKQ